MLGRSQKTASFKNEPRERGGHRQQKRGGLEADLRDLIPTPPPFSTSTTAQGSRPATARCHTNQHVESEASHVNRFFLDTGFRHPGKRSRHGTLGPRTGNTWCIAAARRGSIPDSQCPISVCLRRHSSRPYRASMDHHTVSITSRRRPELRIRHSRLLLVLSHEAKLQT